MYLNIGVEQFAFLLILKIVYLLVISICLSYTHYYPIEEDPNYFIFIFKNDFTILEVSLHFHKR